MVKAVIFDLDGTLIQTEVLKAESYAIAIQELTEGNVGKDQTLKIFNQFVGKSREEVVDGLSEHFYKHLEKSLGIKDTESIGKILVERRLEIYQDFLDDDRLLSKHFCSFTLGLLKQLHKDGFTLVLATMSHLPAAKKVAGSMGIFYKFKLVLTKDDVKHGKPAPDIYNLALKKLQLEPKNCLVIEDSANGIKAAQNAGIAVFGVTNDITRKSVHDCNLLNQKFIVDDLSKLELRVYSFIESKK